MNGIRVPRQDVRCHRGAWIGRGIPAEEIDRAAVFQDRWGGLALPPAPFYEGGPRILGADCPEGSATGQGGEERLGQRVVPALTGAADGQLRPWTSKRIRPAPMFKSVSREQTPAWTSFRCAPQSSFMPGRMTIRHNGRRILSITSGLW